MTIAAGSRLGPYEILSALGAGGMGEVWRARDTRLDRAVAIKVLPDRLASNTELRQRFEREARAVSSLNHPHICTLHDIGHQDGLDYLVMELIEGESLADRLINGPLPTDQVLRYAIQIADALDKAHRAGIVHRDLKPANIMLTKSGTKLLDFGLAKVQAGDSGIVTSATSLPTERHSLTGEGTILGTFQYMAPEQLEGREADARSDIFAFGAVVYEMATGKRAFTGKSQASLIGAILHTEPPAISTIQPMTPPALDRVVKRCLAKDPDDRWQTARDLTMELTWISEAGSQAGVPAPVVAHRKSRERAAWTAAALLLLIALAALPFAVAHLRQAPSAEAVAMRFTIAMPENAATFGPAISPDGRNLVFNAAIEGKTQLWLRPLGSFAARPLPGTEGTAGHPFWSPDNRWIGFLAADKLKKVDLADGTQQTLCNVPGIGGAFGGTWNREGTILFARNGIIYRVSATGGEPTPVPGLDQSRQGIEHRWPNFLPDDRHFLYLAVNAQQGTSDVYLGSLDGKEPTRLLAADSQAIYASSAASTVSGTGGGHLLFSREGALLAQPFEASSLKLTGEPFRVAEGVKVISRNRRADFSVSDTATLVYDPSGASENSQLTWFDRAGKRLEAVGEAGIFSSPRLSPDGMRVVVTRRDPKTRTDDIYVIDLARGTTSPLTFDPADDQFPIWSPDGIRIAWRSHREGTFQLYQKLASGVGPEELLLKSDVPIAFHSWSADGRFILNSWLDPKTRGDIGVLPLAGDRKSFVFLQTPFSEREAHFSPDGRWVAYVSDESGRSEVYVQTFPASSDRWPVSTKGGDYPRWRRDGKELFYVSDDRKMMAVEVKTSGPFEPGIPRALFDLSAVRMTFGGYAGYDVTADGQRFLFVSQMAETSPSSLAVVVNWTAEAKR